MKYFWRETDCNPDEGLWKRHCMQHQQKLI